MRIRAKAFLFSILAALIFSSCNNFFHDLIPPSDNEIKSFRLMDRNGNDVTESSEIDGTNINIKVRPDADISSLLPLIEKPEKSSVFPITIEYIHTAAPSANLLSIAIDMQNSRQNGNLASWALDFVQKNPDFNVPPLDRSLDFRASVPIAVIAGTGNTKIYQVNVEHVEFVDDGSGEYKTGNEILSFSVEGQDGDSVISDSAVEFHMPPDSDLRNIVPSVSVSDGATILPLTQDYILKYVGFSDLVSFYGEYSAAKNPEKFFETWIKKNNITLEETLDIPIDFSSSVPFIIKSAVSSVRIYNVTCTCIDDTPRLLSLVFTKFLNEKLVRDSSVEFGASHTQSVEAVYPAEYISDSAGKEDAFHLVPSFVMDADRATFCIGGGADVELVSGETAITFPGAVSSCTIKVWRGTRSVEYTIDMSSTEDPDTIRSITDFRFPKSKNGGIKTTAMASIVDDGDIGTITVTLLYTAGDESSLNSLYPTFITPGTVERDGSTFNSGNGLYNLLQNPSQKLTCISRDGMYKRVYTLKVNFVEIQPAVAAMRSFSFPMSMNPDLSRDAVGIINDSAGTIMVNVPYRTREIPSSLVADFSATGNVFADGIPQSTGSSRGDFRYSKNYKVIAADDSTVTKTYKVQVAWVYEGVCECSLDSMVFRAADNPTLSSDVQVTITQSELRGSAFLPYGTDSWTHPLIPTFEAHGTVTVNGELQSSGVSSQNFSEDIVYTVTSADGSTRKDYTIRATETGSVIYVDCRATGRNDGSSWENAFTDVPFAANAALAMSNGSATEIWIADRQYPNGASDFKFQPAVEQVTDETSLIIRGGFNGDEKSISEREDGKLSKDVGCNIFADSLKSLTIDSIGRFNIRGREKYSPSWNDYKPTEISDALNISNSSGASITVSVESCKIDNTKITGGSYIIVKSGEGKFEKCTAYTMLFKGDGKICFEDCNIDVLFAREFAGDLILTHCSVCTSNYYEKRSISLGEGKGTFTYAGLYASKGFTSITDSEVGSIYALNNAGFTALDSTIAVESIKNTKSDINIRNCSVIPMGYNNGTEAFFSGLSSVLLQNVKCEKELTHIKIEADNSSLNNCDLVTTVLNCSESAAVTDCTFKGFAFNTSPLMINAPSSVVCTNNKFSNYGTLYINTDGYNDISGNEAETECFETPEGKKKLYSIELGGDATYTFDEDEFAKFTVEKGTSVNASTCKIWGQIKCNEDSKTTLENCIVVGGMYIGSNGLVSVKDDSKITGGMYIYGYLEVADCTIKDYIHGDFFGTGNSFYYTRIPSYSSDFSKCVNFSPKPSGGITVYSGSITMEQNSDYYGPIEIMDEGYLFASKINTSYIYGNGHVMLQECKLRESIFARNVIIIDCRAYAYSNGKAHFSVNGLEVKLDGSEVTGGVDISVGGKLTASNTTILNGLTAKGTVQMTGCNLCSDGGYIDTTGSGWATFTSCTINRNIWGDGTTAAGCVIYGTIFDNSPSSVFRACNLTGEDAYVSSKYCGTMQGCEFNGLFYSDRIRYSTGTFDGCWFNPAEGSSLTGITVSCGATVRNMTFYRHGDTAIDVRDGDSSRTTTIENCKFLANSSTERSGAGVLIATGNALVKNCIFCENYSKYSGGGIAYIVGEPRWCTLQDCLFVNNSCDPGGKDAYAHGPSGSGVNIWNTSCAGTIFDIWGKFSKDGDISAGLPNIVSDFRHAADFL